MSKQIEAITEKTKSIALKVSGKAELSDGVADIGGPTLDWLNVVALKLDGTHRQFGGMPQRSNLNTPEIREYLANSALADLKQMGLSLLQRDEELEHVEEIKKLEEAKSTTSLILSGPSLKAQRDQIQSEIDKLRAEARNADVKALRQIREEAKEIKHLKEGIQRLLQKPALLGADAYIFENVMLIHISRTGVSLLDYATADTDTGQLMIVGFARILPEPISVGGGGWTERKLDFALFEPLDPRIVEEGGQIQVTHLSHEDQIALYSWVDKSLKFTSFLRTFQRLITLQKRDQALSGTVEELQGTLKRVTQDYEELKGKMGTDARGAILSLLLSLLVSQIGLGAIGLLVGIGIAMNLGYTTNTIQQSIYNQTLPHNIIGTTPVTVQTPNPLAFVIPGVSVFAFMLLSLLFNSRRWRRTR